MRIPPAGAVFPMLLVALTSAGDIGPKFYPDDPLVAVRDTQSAAMARERAVTHEYDVLENLFTRPGDPLEDVRARGMNTVEDVPDSAWYTHRGALTPEDVARGPDTCAGPAPGPWQVVSGKADGITPGLVVADVRGITWFLKFDPPGHGGMATSSEVLSTKLFWALGYNVPENHIARLDEGQLVVATSSTIRTPSGKRRMRVSDVHDVLRNAARDADGTYRVLASRRIEGRGIGPFRFHGTRSDDPNDIVPHEHRRELRAFGGVFSAWLNHVDCKCLNTYDAVVEHGGLAVVKHYVLDFGSTIGSAGIRPREPYEGWEYLVEGHNVLKGVASLGFRVAPWRNLPMYRSPGVGAILLDNESWDPAAWRPHYPNAAELRTRPDDRFWAAMKLASLTRAHIEAAVAAAHFRTAEDAAAVTRFLSERRQAILRRYLPDVNPVIAPALGNDGTLTFDNAAVIYDVARRPDAYRTVWWAFDNSSGATRPIGETRTSEPRALAPGTLPESPGGFVKIEISCEGAPVAQWEQPVHVYFRRDARQWTLVGFERTPPRPEPTTP